MDKNCLYTVDEFMKLVSDIQKSGIFKQPLAWFTCDKAWIGLGPEARRVFLPALYNDVKMVNVNESGEIILHDAINWCVAHGYDYKISTTTPGPVLLEQERARQEEYRAAQDMANSYPGMDYLPANPIIPEPDELNRRADMIAECQTKLDHIPYNTEGTTYLEKMENIEFYSLVRNIGKYILEQNRLRLESLKAGE